MPERETIPDLRVLASLLYFSAGVTKRRGDILFRAAATTGARPDKPATDLSVSTQVTGGWSSVGAVPSDVARGGLLPWTRLRDAFRH